MMLTHIGVFLIAVSFAVFAVYLCILLTRISGLITTVGHTAKQMESKMENSIHELELTLVEARSSAVDVQVKLDALTSLVETVENAGDTAETAAEGISDLTGRYADEPGLPGTKPFVGAIHIGELAASLFSTWKKAENVTK
ncbi:hypothetical protein NCCP2716_07030 [Sporosarcina sp. NCCP-2716]|uniref:DUF948 domain-containing protein n=1 Tax=Sporosarcina sp. NCCP-2716 TaxID=2943679 RepID=UPI0020407E60|nr:DUF948 domain-containing protein [Sporosarcina sp. NCCP-2716]GKV68205.1 hypothetical protein NCCP2716_07030 [Sporosarcina sp. NCCP-2716]